jgi:hypothetical protein
MVVKLVPNYSNNEPESLGTIERVLMGPIF